MGLRTTDPGPPLHWKVKNLKSDENPSFEIVFLQTAFKGGQNYL